MSTFYTLQSIEKMIIKIIEKNSCVVLCKLKIENKSAENRNFISPKIQKNQKFFKNDFKFQNDLLLLFF